MSALVVQVPGQPSAVFTEKFTIGRSPSWVSRRDGPHTTGLVIDDEYISTPHVAISPSGESWVVEDLGSTNGTWLNDGGAYSQAARVYGPVTLRKGDKIRVGHTILTVVPVSS